MLESGKDVLHLSFSSKLSAAFNHLSGACEMINEEYASSGRRVVAVDLLGISGGAAVLVYAALQKQKAGEPLDDVADWVRENTVNAQHWFTVNDLIHLHRGGRLSAANAIVGTMLSVKPVLTINKEGRVVAFDKVKGRKRAIAYLAERVSEFADKPEEKALVILHGDCLEDGQELQRLVETNIKFKETFLQYVGPVIGAHAGPDVLGICFIGKERPV
jgi:DegV family protein with EDD domain